MSRTLTPIDISNLPDLERIAEEVRATKTPRILTRRVTWKPLVEQGTLKRIGKTRGRRYKLP